MNQSTLEARIAGAGRIVGRHCTAPTFAKLKALGEAAGDNGKAFKGQDAVQAYDVARTALTEVVGGGATKADIALVNGVFAGMNRSTTASAFQAFLRGVAETANWPL